MWYILALCKIISEAEAHIGKASHNLGLSHKATREQSDQRQEGEIPTRGTTPYGLAEGARGDGQGICINICPLGGTGTAYLFYTPSHFQVTIPGSLLPMVWAAFEPEWK